MRGQQEKTRSLYRHFWSGLLLAGLLLSASGAWAITLHADVTAIDQVIVYNRLGAFNPAGMIFALRRDLVDVRTGLTEAEGGTLSPGLVKLRDDKRPRPLVLRANEGDRLVIHFQNLLSPTPLTDAGNEPNGMSVPAGFDPLTGTINGPRGQSEQSATRAIGVHVQGLELADRIGSDGSHVGRNASSLVAPGQKHVYRYLAGKEGGYIIRSTGSDIGGEGESGTVASGLFGVVNVEPRGSTWYRSQVTHDELMMASQKNPDGSVRRTAGGQPLLDYNAVYPAGHRYAGLPILNIRAGNRIVHSDLTAIIAGGRKYPANPAYPNRNKPFREMTIVFHDEVTTLQAFPGYFLHSAMNFTLSSVKDGFAINYGTGGIGSEIIASRLNVGPMHDCYECKYEEFFLSSWAVGDPAMVVDVPANIGLEDLAPGQMPAAGSIGVKAGKAYYPDDPSNVYHSYLNDRMKIRNLHVGSEQHIFHLHAHQWLFSPDSNGSTYLDSQALVPGTSYSYEIAYNGSGNRNKTPGDSIFHCHFYPHFAQGMWSLWRVHDVFEEGTPLDVNGIPLPNSRALPDGEIAAGTPIPALVPMPDLAMAPMPQADVAIVDGQPQVTPHPGTDGNPGYPFFVAGLAGHRPPTPPLDLVRDGGLPRHVFYHSDGVSEATPLSFDKVMTSGSAYQLAEDGEPVEKAAMNFHARLYHPSFTPDNIPAQFETNGLPPKPGAPFADPCRTDGSAYYGGANGTPVGNPRSYKAAVIELDVQLNKVGWHFNQQRIITLEQDVQPTLSGSRPPEPFVMRANTNDCIDFDHTNLLPNVYQQDDFQVKTPTDVVGQHIHLVKFDVTSADGSGNGFNYEDGTLSPAEVVERIRALNDPLGGGLVMNDGTINKSLVPTSYMGQEGTRTTRQRWYVDPLQNAKLWDRGLGTVFTHDHFGPSTHQQAGLYATLLIEPEGSKWRDPETGIAYGSRSDGGPTSWKADILAGKQSYREFYLEFGDFQLAYTADGRPVNPPGREAIGLPDLVQAACPPPFPQAGPCPEAISAADVGTFVVNYRNEPLAHRVRDPFTNSQAAGKAGDLSFAFSSKIARADPRLNRQPKSPKRLTRDVRPKDPFTPLLRAYEGDRVKLRVQVGATEELHSASMHGVKWLQEPDWKRSGWRNAQTMGISEQFTWDFPLLVDSSNTTDGPADFLYTMDGSVDGYWNGMWGLMRAYQKRRPDLLPLPTNPIRAAGHTIDNSTTFNQFCPAKAPMRRYNISAVSAATALASAPGLADGSIVYNSRLTNGGPLHDPTGILFVPSNRVMADGRLKPNTPVEPLVIRANAGDCIQVTLRNLLPPDDAAGFSTLPEMDGFNQLPMIVDHFNSNQLKPSSHVGLHPQLVSFSVRNSDGANIGLNPVQTVAPGKSRRYTWYAGDVKMLKRPGGKVELAAEGVEFGAINLSSSDPIKHSSKGAVGALVIEPKLSTWKTDRGTRASATITKPNGKQIREFVLVLQDDVNLLYNGSQPVPPVGSEEAEAEDSGHGAYNYRSEPLWLRMGYAPTDGPLVTATLDYSDVLSNSQVGGDPQTPVFTALAGQEVRFRLLQPGGHGRNHTFALHGHGWRQAPYGPGSYEIDDNPRSFVHGSQMGPNPGGHYDIVPLNGAGGRNHVRGDYLYRELMPGRFMQGLWGILRVK